MRASGSWTIQTLSFRAISDTMSPADQHAGRRPGVLPSACTDRGAASPATPLFPACVSDIAYPTSTVASPISVGQTASLGICASPLATSSGMSGSEAMSSLMVTNL